MLVMDLKWLGMNSIHSLSLVLYILRDVSCMGACSKKSMAKCVLILGEALSAGERVLRVNDSVRDFYGTIGGECRGFVIYMTRVLYKL